MIYLLLVTGLNIPAAQAYLIPRPRPLERLNAGLTCRLSLISAPASFGESTLPSIKAVKRRPGFLV
jgi:ATP/maltotriose-dependent transcriptional regulator MalT